MTNIPVKNFWLKPENPIISGFSEFSFGYTYQGKDYSYSIHVYPGNKESEKALHVIFWKIRDSKKGSYLPWVTIPKELKSKLIITDLNSPQTSLIPELLTKVASRLDTLSKLLKWL